MLWPASEKDLESGTVPQKYQQERPQAFTDSGLARRCALLFAICVSLLVGKAYAQGTSQQEEKKGVVSGVVSDVLGSVVSGATVIFEGKSGLSRAITSPVGAYSIDLNPGVYRVSVDASGFDKLVRSEINVLPNSRRQLNMQVLAKVHVFRPYLGAGEEPPEHPALTLVSFNDESIDGVSRIGVKDARILYVQRCVSPLVISFTGISSEPAHARSTFTYDFLTASATKFEVDLETRVVTGCGNVQVDSDGETREYGNCVKIVVRDGKPILTEIKR